jgi:hypothetical protein
MCAGDGGAGANHLSCRRRGLTRGTLLRMSKDKQGREKRKPKQKKTPVKK